MAAPKVSLFYTIRDEKNQPSTTQIKFPTTVDIAILKEFARSTGTLIDAVITGRIEEVSIGIGVEDLPTTWKAAPLANSDVEEGGRFSFLTGIGSKTGFRLPTFDEAYILPGTKQIDVADAAVDALVDRIIAGQTVGIINVSPSDDRGEDITALFSARESFGEDRG